MDEPRRPRGVIVLIEDFEPDYLLTTLAVQAAGWDNPIRWFRDPTAAVGWLRSEGVPPIAFVLVDLHMPQAHGFEVLEQLRSDPRTADIPVAVASSSEFSSDISGADRLGAAGYVRKPITVAQLAALGARLPGSA